VGSRKRGKGPPRVLFGIGLKAKRESQCYSVHQSPYHLFIGGIKPLITKEKTMDYERFFKYELFIGGDNTTGRVNVDLIIDICSACFDSFTGIKGNGVFIKLKEECYIVIVCLKSTECGRIATAVDLLKRELNQESIFVTCQEVSGTLG
jgi:RNase P/RNase MRP subunit POP5